MAATLPPSFLLSSSHRTPSTSSSSSSGRGSHSRDPSAPQEGAYSPDAAAALAGMGVLSAGVGTPSVATRSSLNHTPTSISRSQAPAASSSSATAVDPTLQGSRSSTNHPHHRKRSSSIVMVQKIEQSPEELLDQSAGFNANADWVNAKGAWLIHVLLIFLGKIMLDVVPGMQQDLSWTIVNLGYIAVSSKTSALVDGVVLANSCHSCHCPILRSHTSCSTTSLVLPSSPTQASTIN